MFQRLLLAVDGSDCARRAAKHGLELAARYDAAVAAVSVYPDDAARDRAEAALDAVAALADDVGVPLETEALRGKPAATVVRRAADRDADLIVVGRRGRAGLTARLLGSTTERILRRTGVPVLTVPGSSVDADTGATCGDVLVTTDGSAVAERAAPYGADLARRFDATLHVLSVADVQAEAGVFDAGGVDRAYVERLRDRGEQAVSDLLASVETADLDVRRSVVEGAAHEAIGEYVVDEGVDLLVMSSEGQSNLAGQQLGTVAGRVLRTVDVPVLVVTGD
jgi:nucleotide-binding universal stress UspA family protein